MNKFFTKAGKLMFGRYLLVTNTVSCGGLLGVGDIITQNLEQLAGMSDKHDWNRTAKLCALGTVLGPFNHFWYTNLDKFLIGRAPKTVVKKILLDQTIASPIFAFTFFMGVGTLERQPLETSWGEFKSKFWQVYMADWCLWPAAQAVNFYLLPSHFRVVYVASVTCIWNSFLSFMKHKDSLRSPKTSKSLSSSVNSPLTPSITSPLLQQEKAAVIQAKASEDNNVNYQNPSKVSVAT